MHWHMMMIELGWVKLGPKKDVMISATSIECIDHTRCCYLYYLVSLDPSLFRYDLFCFPRLRLDVILLPSGLFEIKEVRPKTSNWT